MPVRRKFNRRCDIEHLSPKLNKTAKSPCISLRSTAEQKPKEEGLDFLTILQENNGFEINRMESSHDPIVDCFDFNRCCIDDGSEQIHLQNMPLFSVYGMYDVV